MRVVVMGAGGGVGRQAVLAAAAAGHEVVAVARRELDVPAGVSVVVADVRDEAQVTAALAGAQAVLWCVGVTKGSGPDVGRASLPHVVRAAGEGGATRVVTVSGAGVTLPGDVKGPGARFVSSLTRTFARDLVEDKQGEHDVLAGSRLSWTEVRPPRLVDSPGTGSWELTDRAPGLRAAAVSRADVAAAMVALAGPSSGSPGSDLPDTWDRRSPFLHAVPRSQG
jgi:putative NADH-flavin reductase